MRLFRNRPPNTSKVLRTSVTYFAVAPCGTYLFLLHFDVICDLLLTRSMATGSNPVEALIFFRLLLSNCLNCLNLHREWHLLNTLKFFISYYIASSVSGQDAPNPVLWLATCCIHQETFLQKPLLK